MTYKTRTLRGSNPGTAEIYGADDFDKIGDLLNGVVTDAVTIAAPFTVKDGVLMVRNPANTFQYTIKGSALASNKDLTLPLITANDTLVSRSSVDTISGAKTHLDSTLKYRNRAGTATLTMRGPIITSDAESLLNDEYDFLIFIDPDDSNKVKAKEGKSQAVLFSHAADTGIILNQVIAAVSDGAKISFLPGTYTGTTQYLNNSKKRIQHIGNGAIISGFTWKTLGNAQSTNVEKCLFRGFTFSGASAGLIFDSAFAPTIEHCSFDACTVGVSIESSVSWTELWSINNSHFNNCIKSVVFKTPTGTGTGSYINSQMNTVTFNASTAQTANYTFIEVQTSAQVNEGVWQNQRFWFDKGVGIVGIGMDISGDTTRLKLFKPIFENFGTAVGTIGIRINTAATAGPYFIGRPIFQGAGTWTAKFSNAFNKYVMGTVGSWRQTDAITPSATINTYGTAVACQSGADWGGMPNLYVIIGGTLAAGETVTVEITGVTYSAFAPVVTKTYTATGTYSLTGADYFTLLSNNFYYVNDNFSVRAKSSIATTAATVNFGGYDGGAPADYNTTFTMTADYYVYIDPTTSSIYARHNKTGYVKYSHATDAGNVMNSVINEIAATTPTGGTIAVGPGTFNVTTTIVPKNYIKILGSGYSTIFKLANTTNVDVFKSFNFATLTGTNSSGGVHSVILRDFCIDGNKANNVTTCYGLRKYGFGWNIENLIVSNCKDNGIYSEWGTALGAPAPHSMEEVWSDVKVHTSGAANIKFTGPHDSKWYNVVCYEGGAGNVICASDANTDGSVEMYGCHFWGPVDTTARGLWVYAASVYAQNLIVEGSVGAAGIGIHTENGGVLRGDVHVFSNETGLRLASQNNDVYVYAHTNTYGIICVASYNKIAGRLESNTSRGIWIANALSNLTIDIRTKVNPEHIRWDDPGIVDTQLRAHIFTAGGEIAFTGSPALTSNSLRIYSSGAGTNYTTTTPVTTDVTQTLTLKTLTTPTLTTPVVNGITYGDVAINNTNSPYTILATTGVIRADATSGAITINLPTAVGIAGRSYKIYRTDVIASTNLITIDANSTETIDGNLNYILYPTEWLHLESDGANWQVIARPSPDVQGYYFLKNSTNNRRYVGGLAGGNAVLLTSTTTPAANTLWATPFYVVKTTKFDTISFWVTTNVAAKSGRASLYRDNGNCYPGALIFDGGAISVATTGVKEATITSSLQVLQPGLYWLTWETDSTVTLQIKGLPGAGDCIAFAGQDSTIAAPPGFAYSVAHTFGASPNPYTASATLITTASAVGTIIPAVGLRAI